MSKAAYKRLERGTVIPAMPLALHANRQLDERRQRALIRYYAAAGAGGLAVGVHTTQFEIRDPQIALFEPLLALAAEELARADEKDPAKPLVRIAGICGATGQALAEASTACRHGYHAGLLSLAALRDATDDELIVHCQAVAEVIPIIGFYLQPAVGGRRLSYSFWRRFAEIDRVVAIKIAPFNRYQTLDVVRAVAESGREDLALYTGNDDNILYDLLTPFQLRVGQQAVSRHIVGGLLGHWAVWTHSAVELFQRCRMLAARSAPVPMDLLAKAVQVTDSNAAVFDAAHQFRGCIPGIHEVLRRQGLLAGRWCLDEHLELSPGQAAEIDRVQAAYPELIDDPFVAEHLDEWLAD